MSTTYLCTITIGLHLIKVCSVCLVYEASPALCRGFIFYLRYLYLFTYSDAHHVFHIR